MMKSSFLVLRRKTETFVQDNFLKEIKTTGKVEFKKLKVKQIVAELRKST